MRGSALLLLALAGCEPATDGGGGTIERAVSFDFTADPGAPGSEEYFCYGRDAAPLEGLPIRTVTFDAPLGSVALHHLQLFAIVGDFPDGPVACEGIPAHSVELDVITPAGAAFALPDGVGLALPEGTRRLVAQAHVMRLADGPPLSVHVALHASNQGLEHLAGYLRIGAPVPAIRPFAVENASARCRIGGPLETVASWPHMHHLGSEFHGAVVRSDGRRDPLVDVTPWQFDEQRIYAVTGSLDAGDAIETACTWRNPGAQYVFPGVKSTDEMCSQAVIAWPVENAFCLP